MSVWKKERLRVEKRNKERKECIPMIAKRVVTTRANKSRAGIATTTLRMRHLHSANSIKCRQGAQMLRYVCDCNV